MLREKEQRLQPEPLAKLRSRQRKNDESEQKSRLGRARSKNFSSEP
jgi:hypothetical protein